MNDTMQGKHSSIHKMLENRMYDQGWDSVRHFCRGSKVPFAIETVRRLITGKDYRAVHPFTIAIVAKYLGYDNDEIKDILKTHTDDKDVWKMLGTADGRLTAPEMAIVHICQVIANANPDLQEEVSRQLELLAMAAGVQGDVQEELKLIRKSKTRRTNVK